MREIDRFDVAVENDHTTEQLAKRVTDMIGLEIASGHLVQHRRKHREIFAADEGHVDVLAFCGRAVEVPRGFYARKTSPENENALFGSGAIHFCTFVLCATFEGLTHGHRSGV